MWRKRGFVSKSRRRKQAPRPIVSGVVEGIPSRCRGAEQSAEHQREHERVLAFKNIQTPAVGSRLRLQLRLRLRLQLPVIQHPDHITYRAPPSVVLLFFRSFESVALRDSGDSASSACLSRSFWPRPPARQMHIRAACLPLAALLLRGP